MGMALVSGKRVKIQYYLAGHCLIFSHGKLEGPKFHLQVTQRSKPPVRKEQCEYHRR